MYGGRICTRCCRQPRPRARSRGRVASPAPATTKAARRHRVAFFIYGRWATRPEGVWTDRAEGGVGQNGGFGTQRRRAVCPTRAAWQSGGSATHGGRIAPRIWPLEVGSPLRRQHGFGSPTGMSASCWVLRWSREVRGVMVRRDRGRAAAVVALQNRPARAGQSTSGRSRPLQVPPGPSRGNRGGRCSR